MAGSWVGILLSWSVSAFGLKRVLESLLSSLNILIILLATSAHKPVHGCLLFDVSVMYKSCYSPFHSVLQPSFPAEQILSYLWAFRQVSEGRTHRYDQGTECYCCLIAKSCPTLATTWTVACQAPLSMGFPGQEYWSGLPFPPGDLSNLGIEPVSPAWHTDSLPLSGQGSPWDWRAVVNVNRLQ